MTLKNSFFILIHSFFSISQEPVNNKWYKFSDTLVEPLGKSDSITHLVGTEKDPMMPNGGKAVNGNAGNGNKKGGSKSSKVENGAGSKQVWTMEKDRFIMFTFLLN